MDDVNVTMIRHYFIFRLLALLEEWKSISFTTQCTNSTFLLAKCRKDQSLVRHILSHEFYNVIVTLQRCTLFFETSVTGIANSEDCESYIWLLRNEIFYLLRN